MIRGGKNRRLTLAMCLKTVLNRIKLNHIKFLRKTLQIGRKFIILILYCSCRKKNIFSIPGSSDQLILSYIRNYFMQ